MSKRGISYRRRQHRAWLPLSGAFQGYKYQFRELQVRTDLAREANIIKTTETPLLDTKRGHSIYLVRVAFHNKLLTKHISQEQPLLSVPVD